MSVFVMVCFEESLVFPTGCLQMAYEGLTRLTIVCWD